VTNWHVWLILTLSTYFDFDYATGSTTGKVFKLNSLHFNGHFPGEPGLAGVYRNKGWWRWWWQLDYWSYKSCKAPVKSSPPTNLQSVFLQAACPFCHPTNSVKALKGREKYHIPWTCLPQAHLGVFQLCLWPLVAPGYLGGGLPCLSSALITPIFFKKKYQMHQIIFADLIQFLNWIKSANMIWCIWDFLNEQFLWFPVKDQHIYSQLLLLMEKTD